MSYFILVFVCFYIIFSVSTCKPILSQNDLVQGLHCKTEMKMEILPGSGWDGLRSIEMAKVLKRSYSQCQATEDGMYLLPNDVYVTPIKSSTINLIAEFFDKWRDYTTITAKSFEVQTGTSVGYISVSGSYGEDYQSSKEKFINHDSSMTRVIAKRAVYQIKSSITSEINPQLMTLFWDALGAYASNNLEKTDLIFEIIVRDYGTHYISMVEAGAMLVQEDFISNDIFKNSNVDSHTVKVAASAKFQLMFGVSAGIKWENTDQVMKSSGYSNYTLSSNLEIIGGDMLSPNTSSQDLNEWINSLPNNLATIDRNGIPISELITPNRFQNISLEVLEILRERMDKAIEKYYLYNTYKGCMTFGSTNFDISANVDDGSCNINSSTLPFGGVYQTCVSIKKDNGDMCEKIKQINLRTNNFSCPTGYSLIHLLHSNVSNYARKSNCQKICNGVKIFKWCAGNWSTPCEDVLVESQAVFDTYWCVSVDHNTSSWQGYKFGGLYSTSSVNPVTKSNSCPTYYKSVKLASDITLCISDNNNGNKLPIKFGGFYSCSIGNPMVPNGNESYASDCPPGYSEHLAAIDNGCEIYYCVKDVGNEKPIPIKRPPFMNVSLLYYPTLGSQNLGTIVDKFASPNQRQSVFSRGVIAGIVIAGVVIIATVALIVNFILKRKRNVKNAAAVNEGNAHDGPASAQPAI